MWLCSLLHVCTCGAQKSVSGIFFNHLSFWDRVSLSSNWSSSVWLDKLDTNTLKSTHAHPPTPSLVLTWLWLWSALSTDPGRVNLAPHPCTLCALPMSLLFSNIAWSSGWGLQTRARWIFIIRIVCSVPQSPQVSLCLVFFFLGVQILQCSKKRPFIFYLHTWFDDQRWPRPAGQDDWLKTPWMVWTLQGCVQECWLSR